jgi:branched-chain amino acid transport system permease protein
VLALWCSPSVVPFVASDYLFRAILIPFVIMSLAALG